MEKTENVMHILLQYIIILFSTSILLLKQWAKFYSCGNYVNECVIIYLIHKLHRGTWWPNMAT